MFLGSIFPIKPTGMLCDLTGSGKSNMAAGKTEVHKSQLADQLGTRFHHGRGRHIAFPTSGGVLCIHAIIENCVC